MHFDGSSWERVDFLGVATNLVVPVGQALSAFAGWALYDAFAKWGVSAEIMSYLGEEEHGHGFMLIGFGVAPLISLFMIYIQLDLDDMHRRVSELSSFKLATCERENTPEARRHDEQVMGQIAAWFAREEEVLGEDLSNASAAKVSASTDLGVQNFEHHIRRAARPPRCASSSRRGTSARCELWSALWRALDWDAAYLVRRSTGNGRRRAGLAGALPVLALRICRTYVVAPPSASWRSSWLSPSWRRRRRAGGALVGWLLTMADRHVVRRLVGAMALHPTACSNTRCELAIG